MNKTKIEWCDYTVNPVKGLCPMACPYCYARAMYRRFKWDETIRFNFHEMNQCEFRYHPGPAKIFIGSTMELFGDWIPDWWMQYILQVVKHISYHTFIFLTKKPENLTKWNPWPENAWVGATATETASYQDACRALRKVEARVRFISLEPLLGGVYTAAVSTGARPPIDWLIIGAQTGKGPKPSPEETRHRARGVIDDMDEYGIPLFLKDNLHWPEKRQEWPGKNSRLPAEGE